MSSRKGIYIFTLMGLLLGITLDRLISVHNPNVFYYSFIILFCILYTLAYDDNNSLRLIGTSLIVALFLSLPLFAIVVDKWNDNSGHLLSFLIGFPLFVYVGHSFHYAYHHDNTWRVNYSTLFEAVWTTIPLLFVASIFASLTNVLIMLGAFIFKTVGNDYLWNLYFNNHHFNFICNTVFFFLGLAIGQQNIKLIASLRFLLLKMMYYLFPVLAVISILYSVLYIINVLTGGQTSIDPLVVLLPLNILGIIFFNAYFQDGDTDTEFSGYMRLLLCIYRIILFIMAVVMVHNILRDFTVETNLFIYLLIALLFPMVYAITACLSKEMERTWIQRGNIITALFFLISLFLLNLPYAPADFNISKGAKSLYAKLLVSPPAAIQQATRN